MKFRGFPLTVLIMAVLAYVALLGFDVRAAESDSLRPAPGSRGDTLNRVDARMALLVYELLDSNDRVKGADIVRGRSLFLKNCKACHGDDGRRVDFSEDHRDPRYIGTRAVYDVRTFWYMMNFGDSVRGMLPYYDEIELRDMIDIAGFAQTLPTK